MWIWSVCTRMGIWSVCIGMWIWSVCTRMGIWSVCIWMWIWSVCIGTYKLNSTRPWRCSWNVNLGTAIFIFCVRIVMQQTRKYEIFLRASDWITPTKSTQHIFLINIFLQIMACKLTNLSDFTPDKNLSCSEAGRRRLEIWPGSTKFGSCKNHFQTNLS